MPAASAHGMYVSMKPCGAVVLAELAGDDGDDCAATGFTVAFQHAAVAHVVKL